MIDWSYHNITINHGQDDLAGKAGTDGHAVMMGWHSRNIDQVVVFIREIADKTNLLALNATTEVQDAAEAIAQQTQTIQQNGQTFLVNLRNA